MRSYNLKKQAVAIYWLFAFLYWEILAHAGMYDQFQGSFRYALGFTGALALVMGLVAGLLPKTLLFPANLLLTLAGTVLYGSQMVYCFIFGTPYSISQMGMGAGAVTQFYREMLGAMQENWLWLAALLLPLAVQVILKTLNRIGKPEGIFRFVPLVLACALVPAV